MTQIILDIPDAVTPRVVDAICARGGWTAADGNRGAFAKTWMIKMVKRTVVAYESEQAGLTAAAAATATAETDITIT